MLTAAVAVGGWYIQRNSEERDIASRETLALQDRLAQYTGDLGDVSATKRLAAVSYIGAVYGSLDAPSRREVAAVLPHQFAAEDDPRVKASIGNQIIEIVTEDGASRSDFLTSIIADNQREKSQFIEVTTRLVGEIVGPTLTASERERSFGLFSVREPVVAKKVALAILGIGPEAGSLFVGSQLDDLAQYEALAHERRFKFTPGTGRTAFGEALVPSLREHLTVDSRGVEVDRRGSRNLYAAMEASSELLIKIIVVGVHTDGLDLSDTFILKTDSRALDLTGATLTNANILGTCDSVTLDFSNLSGANLGYCVGLGSLRAANVEYAILNDSNLECPTSGTNLTEAYLIPMSAVARPEFMYAPRYRHGDRSEGRTSLSEKRTCDEQANVAGRKCPWSR